MNPKHPERTLSFSFPDFLSTSASPPSSCTVTSFIIVFIIMFDRLFSDRNSAPSNRNFRDQECFLVFLVLTLMGSGCYMSGWQRDSKDEAVHQPLDSFVSKMLVGG